MYIRLWKLPEPLVPYPLMEVIILPGLHRLVQRLKEEMLTKNLVQGLAHQKCSLSNLRGAQFAVNHCFNWDRKASRRRGESCCFQRHSLYCACHHRGVIQGGQSGTLPEVNPGHVIWGYKSHLGIFGPFHWARTHSPLQYFSVAPWEMARLHEFLG